MPLQSLSWLLCCRQGFTLLRRDYGEKEEEEESFELRSKDELLSPGRDTLDVAVSQPLQAANGPSSVSEIPEEMRSLIIDKNKGTIEDDSSLLVKGWLYKEVHGTWLRQRKHWFVLTQDALEYYSSDEKNAKRLGMLVLTSLCTVIWPDKQTYKETGYWNVTVYGRKLCYRLSTKHFNEAIHWACAIQKVIESKAPVETPTQLLIRDIEENKFNPEAVESIYKHNSILKYTQSPLYAPLLPFQYGSVEHKIYSNSSSKGYSTLRDEAVKIFNSIQQLETARDAVPLIQGVLQTCQDLQPLRDEVYCQLIKQTSGVSSPETEAHLRYWQLLTCMSCTFLPGLPVLKYLRFHLKRIQSKHPDTEADNYAAFIAEALEKTRGRELVPSWEEIHILMNRQEMVCTVHCPGQEVSQVPISSHTTAEEVVKKMVQHLGLQHSPNTFALYEQNCHREWLVASSSIVADVLTKFENLTSKDPDSQWRLCFKVYCFLDTENIPIDSVEFLLLFEQAHEMVVRGHLPTSEEDLQYLSALRLQSLNGDFNLHAPVPPLEELFPGHLIEVRALASARMLLTKPSNCSSRFHAGFLSGALHNGLWGQMAAHKQKAEEDLRLRSRMKEEGLSVMAAIVERWKLLQGLSREDAITTYLSNVKQWSGFGSTLYDIDFYVVNVPTLWEKRKGSSACLNKHEISTENCLHRVWLGIAAQEVSLYKQGHREPFECFSYNQISSFGICEGNTFKIIMAEKELIFETSSLRKLSEIGQLMNAYIAIAHRKHQRRAEDELFGLSLTIPESPSHPV